MRLQTQNCTRPDRIAVMIASLLAALVMCIVAIADSPAAAAEPAGPAADDSVAFPDTQEPVRAGGKKRRNKGKRNKRKRHKKDKPKKAKKNKPNKKNKNKKHGTTEAADRPTDNPQRDKPKQDKPGHDKPTPDKPAYDPKRPDTHHKRQRLVCIGGRVRAGRCLCRRTHKRRELRRSVVSCRSSATVVVLPQLVPDQPPVLDPPPAQREPGISPPALPQGDLPPFADDEILVALSSDSADDGDDAIARDLGLDVIERVPLSLLDLRVVRFRIPDGRSVTDVVAALSGDARVISAQPNYTYRQDAGDAETPAQALQYALAKVDLDAAHEKARGRGVLVAVIDSGIDADHPGLDGAVLDVLDVTDKGETAPHDHGTAIAGIIRARGQVQGIAPDAGLLSVRAFVPSDEGPNAATTMGILRGIAWAAEKNTRIINMSFSGAYDPLMAQGVAAAHERQIIMVAAAGNGGPEGPAAYPAAYDEVIAVTATDIADRLYVQANRGAYIAVAAPGVDVLVLALDQAHLVQSGTSFAAAHVSGILALMLEQQSEMTADEALWALTAAAHDLGPAGWDDEFGAGRTDAAKTLRLLGHLYRKKGSAETTQ